MPKSRNRRKKGRPARQANYGKIANCMNTNIFRNLSGGHEPTEHQLERISKQASGDRNFRVKLNKRQKRI